MVLSLPAIQKPKWQYNLVLYSWAIKYCQCPKCPKMNRQALAQLVIASLVSTCAVVNGQSADYNPLYIGKMITMTGCNSLHLKRNQNIFPRKVWRSHSQCKRGHICTWWEDNLHPGGNRLKKHRTQKNTKSNGLQLHDTAVIRPTEILLPFYI